MQRHNLRAYLGDKSLGHLENISVDIVYSQSNISRDFDMLQLVVAYGHEVGIVQEYICRHKHGVIHKSHIYVVGVLQRLVFELRHSVHLAYVGIAIEQPRKLAVLVYVRLKIYRTSLHVQTYGKQKRVKTPAVCVESLRLLSYGNGMQIGKRENTIVVFIRLHSAPVVDRSYIVAQSHYSGGLNCTVYSLHKTP